MANFDIFEWRQKYLFNESANNNISENFSNVVKKVIKDNKYEEFELNLSSFTPEAQKLIKSVTEDLNDIQEEGNKSIELEEGTVENACRLAVKIVGDIAATFPKFFAEASAEFGNDYPKRFVYALLADEGAWISNTVLKVFDGEVEDDGKTNIGVLKTIGRKGFNLFITMVALAIKVLKVAGYTSCAAAGIADLPEALIKAMYKRSGKDRSGMSGDKYEKKYGDF